MLSVRKKPNSHHIMMQKSKFRKSQEKSLKLEKPAPRQISTKQRCHKMHPKMYVLSQKLSAKVNSTQVSYHKGGKPKWNLETFWSKMKKKISVARHLKKTSFYYPSFNSLFLPIKWGILNIFQSLLHIVIMRQRQVNGIWKH